VVISYAHHKALAIVKNVSCACPEEEEFGGLRFAVFPIPEVLPEKKGLKTI